MDILRFINSKDIREHLKTINYEFNSLEVAWLIYQCRNATIEEKHVAWRELINTMPDCKIEERMNTIPHDSLHKYLREYIDCERYILDEFSSPKEDWIYTLEWYEQNNWYQQDKFYKTFEAAQNEFLEEYKKWHEKYIYRIKKQKSESNQHIVVYFNLENQISYCEIGGFSDAINKKLYYVFDGLWFDFPTPFKKGDILCEYDFYGKEYGYGPFVMTGITPEGVRESTRKNGDRTDMNAWGYFQDSDGRVFCEVMCNYMDIEYYRGELKGPKRNLTAFSSYAKGEIDVTLLCEAYHFILCEEVAKNNRPTLYTNEGMKLAGIEE